MHDHEAPAAEQFDPASPAASVEFVGERIAEHSRGQSPNLCAISEQQRTSHTLSGRRSRL